ncbi:MAG: DUF2298 domain-containing protein [Aggregatilineales bacterium]
MIFDWISREGWIVLNWWLLVSLAGAAVLPMMVRVFAGFPDRGYTLARPAGVLLTSFVFWLLASFGFFENTAGNIVFSWVIVLVISLFVYFRLKDSINKPFDWRAWWTENRRVVIVTEVLFAVLLVGWAIVRAHQNGIYATEKPMDLAFMSAIFRSESFPPNDPWLSDYSISYYYFGYVMAAMLSKVSGVWTTIGYNMHIAMLFAMTGTAAFGVTYNLIRSRAFRFVRVGEFSLLDRAPSKNVAIGFGVLAMIFVIFLGNFQTPLVEYPYQSGQASQSYLEFWDMKNRWEPLPEDGGTSDLTRWEYWWWFDAARTISDQNLLDPAQFTRSERHVEAIAEFPQFSFLLADSHPHVMTLPYVLLAIGIALNVLLIGQNPDALRVLFYGICVGALVFLNTWDAPIYISAVIGADVLRRLIRHKRLAIDDWIQVIVFGVALVVIMIVAYLPFLVGFRSQLGGVLPNLIYPTHSPQFFLMFGPFILLLPLFLGVEVWRARRDGRMNWSLGGQTIVFIFAILFGILIFFTAFGLLSDAVRQDALRYIDENGGLGELMPELVSRRLGSVPMLALLLIGFWLVIGRLFPRRPPAESVDTSDGFAYAPATGFALMLVGVGLSLTVIPEFVYLRDNFSTRMNTVFKFYYQAWIVVSIGTAYGLYIVFADRQSRPTPLPVKALAGVVLAIVLFLGAWYPVLGIYNRMFMETGRRISQDPAPLTLDGGRSAVSVSQDDYNVLMCLNDLVEGDDVIVGEATGGSYDIQGSGRVGGLTGLPVVIGWQGHEGQWRGTSYFSVVGSRPQDIQRLYEDLRYDIVQEIIDQYGIDYIIYGTAERNHYGGAGDEKFRDQLDVVCESGDSRIYRVNSQLASLNP